MAERRIEVNEGEEFALDLNIKEFVQATSEITENKDYANGFIAGMSYVLEQITKGNLIIISKE